MNDECTGIFEIFQRNVEICFITLSTRYCTMKKAFELQEMQETAVAKW